MGKLNINGGGVDTNKKMASIDERFGPYTSTEAADAALGGQGRNTITAGLTVGILTDNAGVKEYWYQPNKKTGQLELIPKGGNAADSPTEGNFASFDANGNEVDSGCNEGTFIKGVKKNGDDLTPDVNGKVNVEVQDGKSAYELYVDEYKEAHSGSTEGVLDEDEWLDSLDAYGVYVKDTTDNPVMTRSEWLDSLKGEKGDDAINPFKGWFNAITTGNPGEDLVVTDEVGNLEAAYPNPVISDYAYIKTWDIDTTQSPQVETPITKIYECTIAGTWSYSGRIADTSNVQTFASREEVNETYIDDTHLNNPASGALAKAEDVKILKDGLYGIPAEETLDKQPSNSYTGSILRNSESYHLWERENANTSNTIYCFLFTGGNSGYTHIRVTTANNSDYLCVILFTKKELPSEKGEYSFKTLLDGGYLSSIYTTYEDIGIVGRNSTEEFEIPDDAVRVYITKNRGNKAIVSETLGSVQLIKRYIDGGDINVLYKDMTDTQGAIENIQETIENVPSVEQDVSIMKDLLVDDVTKILTESDFSNAKVYPSTSTWLTSKQSNATLYKTVKAGDMIHIVGKTANNIKSCIALTNSIPVSEGAFNFAENNGEQWFLRFGNNESGDITVVNDCFLVVWNQPDGNTLNNIFPTSLTIRTVSAKNSDKNADITRHSINICDESKCIKGTINSDGTIATGNNIVTDLIPISLAQSYNYAEIIKACCSINKSYSVGINTRYRYFFGYNAVQIALYDGDKNFIGILNADNVDVTDSSTVINVCIDKDFYTYEEDGGDYTIINNHAFVPASQTVEEVTTYNQKLFDIVKYIRVEFPSGSIEHYVSVANDRNVPEYSVYNEDDLFATSEFIADKIHNSDGAIENLIKTALSYLHNQTQINPNSNDIGYGNTRTAEDQSCAVISSGYNPVTYNGEKKQINCSTFVKLCIEGIKYENSRYVLGTDAKNIPTNGYVFDSKAQYQQRNASNSIPVSDYGKMYACLIFKYAEDRGFAYKVADGYANVEVGDVLFINSDSYANDNSWSYKGVSHCYLVTNVQKLNNGNKYINTVEVSGGKPENPYPVREYDYITMRENCNYGARFPLPYVKSLVKDIVLEHTDTIVENLATGAEATLSSVTISKDIAPYGEFTAVVKLKEYNKDVIVKVYTSDDISRGLVSNNELVRGDGIYIRHFHLPNGNSLSGNKQTLTVNAKNIGDDTISIIELDDVMVFDGYVTM